MTHENETTTTNDAIDNASNAIDNASNANDVKTSNAKTRKTRNSKTQSTQSTQSKTSKTSKTKSNVVKTFTTCDIAREYNRNAKTLRAKIRRNIAQFDELFFNDTRHVFRDNATTRKRVLSLLNINAK